MRGALSFVLLAIYLPSLAQCERLDSASQALKMIWDGRWEQEVYDQGDPFYFGFLKLLEDPSTFGCKLDSSSFVGDTWSTDGRLRVLSWDHLSTGSGHDMVSIAQYRSASGIIRLKVLCAASDESDMADVEFYRIHHLPGSADPSYLLIGWGTHGGGSRHCAAMVVRIEDEDLMVLNDIFPFEGDSLWPTDQAYVVTTQRSHDIDLRYDEAASSLSHNEFKPFTAADSEPWSQPTGHRAVLLWTEGRFKRKPE